MDTPKVGIREFRADLAEYIASDTPIAVTRHGHTVGYFIPTPGQLEANVAALEKAGKALHALLEKHHVREESIVTGFKAARRRAGLRAAGPKSKE